MFGRTEAGFNPGGKTMRARSIIAAALVATLPLQLTAEAEDEEAFAQEELEQMLAPIALYPDALLTQIMIAATYPLEVVQAAQWSSEHPDLEGEEAVAAVEEKDWDPSVKALVAFPRILERMHEDIEWTRQLGDAVLLQEEQVMETVQVLRRHAADAGNLESLEHVRVRRDDKIIVIEPAHTRVVYVPYYDTHVVYGHWWRPSHPPVRWWTGARFHRSRSSVHFAWSAPVRVSVGFHFATSHWGHRNILVVHPRHRHTYKHRFTHGRKLSRERFSGFTRWKHDPRHRRNVDYRSDRLRERFERSRRATARFEFRSRSTSRDRARRLEALRDRQRSSRSDVERTRVGTHRTRHRAPDRERLRSQLTDRQSALERAQRQRERARESASRLDEASRSQLQERLAQARQRSEQAFESYRRGRPNRSELGRRDRTDRNERVNRFRLRDADTPRAERSRTRSVDRIGESRRATSETAYGQRRDAARTERRAQRERSSNAERPRRQFSRGENRRSSDSVHRSRRTSSRRAQAAPAGSQRRSDASASNRSRRSYRR